MAIGHLRHVRGRSTVVHRALRPRPGSCTDDKHDLIAPGGLLARSRDGRRVSRSAGRGQGSDTPADHAQRQRLRAAPPASRSGSRCERIRPNRELISSTCASRLYRRALCDAHSSPRLAARALHGDASLLRGDDERTRSMERDRRSALGRALGAQGLRIGRAGRDSGGVDVGCWRGRQGHASAIGSLSL